MGSLASLHHCWHQHYCPPYGIITGNGITALLAVLVSWHHYLHVNPDTNMPTTFNMYTISVRDIH